MSKILSFRGLLEDGGQDTINLETIRGTTGYRVVKFEVMANKPGLDNYEAVLKIYKIKQTVIDALIDFSDNTMLAAATYQGNASAFNYPTTQFTVFDNEIFNQDIYVTCQDLQNGDLNYYIELVQMDLNMDEATVATLKNIRNTQ
jgi:hypothetical protein